MSGLPGSVPNLPHKGRPLEIWPPAEEERAMGNVDKLSPEALEEARAILADRVHAEGRSVDDVLDEELVAMVEDTYEGGAAQLQNDMDGNWA